MDGSGWTGEWVDRSGGNREGNREWMDQVGPGNVADRSEGDREWIDQVGLGNGMDMSEGNREGNRECVGKVRLGNGADKSEEIGREIGNEWVRMDWGMGWTDLGEIGNGWVMLDRGLGWTGQGEIWGHRKDRQL